MIINGIEQATAKTGNPYKKLTIDGKTYNYFDDLKGLKVNDNVECTFETNGKYTNLKTIKKSDGMTQATITPTGKHDLVVTRAEKPNSYEFGKAGNRFKIYYDTAIDLKEHIAMLKANDLIIEDEIKTETIN